MPKLRFLGDQPISLFQPEGGPDAITVEPGQQVTVPGALTKDQPEDAYVIGDGDDARAWAKSLWELIEDKPAAKAPVKEN